MPKSNAPRLRLSFEQADGLCRELVPIGDQALNYMARLSEAGFNAFLPRQEFIKSFAETPEDVEIHRRCFVENVKEGLGRPTMRMSDEEYERLYFSPFLQSLREQRDQDNACAVEQLRNLYGGGESAWRREIDPCQRALVKDRCDQVWAHQARFAVMLEAERRTLEEEADRCSTGLGRPSRTFDPDGRCGFLAAVMERDAAALGFQYDKTKSQLNYPVFSKPVTDDWHLCWTIKYAPSFLDSFEGLFEPLLELRSRQMPSNSDKAEVGEYLLLRYEPVGLGAYRPFLNLDQLERNIKAHLYFYSLMTPAFESGIKRALIKYSA